MGEVLANKISGKPEMFNLLSALKHIRIPAGPKLGSALIAIGMLYHRLIQS